MTDDKPGELALLLKQGVAQLQGIEDPATRAKAAQDASHAVQSAVNDFGQIRRDAMTAMLDAGQTQADIARVLELTPERVRQLMSGGPRPARAVLGTAGRLLVALGGKFEAEKQNPVASAEAFAAYEELADAARSLGLEAKHEVIPPPGLVELNRENLVVIGSPRILPFLTQVLPADPAYGWGSDDRGWFLLDKATGDELRSPADSGGSQDYAYVGRLPRPDGTGSFLYLAGIHAQGTLGAALWLTENLDQVYRETRGKRWSVLLKVDYDHKRKITATERLTKLARHEGAK